MSKNQDIIILELINELDDGNGVSKKELKEYIENNSTDFTTNTELKDAVKYTIAGLQKKPSKIERANDINTRPARYRVKYGILEKVVTEFEQDSYDRDSTIKNAESDLNDYQKYRLQEFANIREALDKCIKSCRFAVDHCKSLKTYGSSAHHPDNLHIIPHRANSVKGSQSTDRFSWEEQKAVLDAAVDLAIKSRLEVNQTLYNRILDRFQLIY